MAAIDLFPARVAIVNPDGTATPEFLRAMRAIHQAVGGTIGDAGNDVFAPFLPDVVSEASIQQPAPEQSVSETVTQPAEPAQELAPIAQPSAPDVDCPVIQQPQQIDLSGKQDISEKDASGGYVGKTLEKINFWNAARTFMSFFTNAATAARTYTFQDRSGTIADDTDLALKANKAGDTFSGTVAYSGAYASVYHADVTPAALTVAAGGTVTFSNFAGMIVVNDHSITGNVTLWLVGGGACTAVGSAGGTVGAMALSGSGYRWTNTSASPGEFSFYIVRTRTAA